MSATAHTPPRRGAPGNTGPTRPAAATWSRGRITNTSTRRAEAMKLASYIVDGRPGFGVVMGDGVVTLSGRTKYASLREVLTAGALGEIKQAAAGKSADHKLSD